MSATSAQVSASSHWSVVLAAQVDNPARAHIAIEQPCPVYWSPLYAHLRRNGHQSVNAAVTVKGL